mmetsp:Transcript_21514/g.60938  ORF Transcript_21514/g.60938 Transcript_21514/m.60938 type:complete len:146 (-) Transcript_21514:163-600(-)
MGRKNTLSEAQKQVANGIGIGLLVYGFSIAALGAIGAGLHGFEKKAMHSLYSGLGCLFFMLICYALLKFSNHRTIAVCAAAASVAAEFLFLIIFAIQAVRSRRDPAKQDRFYLFVAMECTTVIGLLLAFKPLLPMNRRSRKVRTQ